MIDFYSRKWSKETHDYFHKLWKNGDAAEAGVTLIPTIRITTDQPYDVPWKDVVYGYTDLSETALERFNSVHKRNYK